MIYLLEICSVEFVDTIYNCAVSGSDSMKGSWFTICGDAFPFHASMLRPASQAGPMHESTGVGEVSCAALLINEACVSIVLRYPPLQ